MDSVKQDGYSSDGYEESSNLSLPIFLENKMNLEVIIGMEKEAVLELLTRNKIRWRIVYEDGESFIVTMDHDPDRVNLSFVDGVVKGFSKG